MNLIVLRHGEAGSRIAIPEKDNERVLTESGKNEIIDVAKGLKSMKLKLTLIATSPLMRALETAKIVAKEMDKNKILELWEELKPEGDHSILYGRLSKLKEDSTVLIVGHEPYLSSMISEIVTGRKTSKIVLKKAGSARISLDSFTPKPSGKLRWLLTPKQLKKLA